MSAPVLSSHAEPAKLISVLFFLSGVSGLSYEVIWFKHFSHVWGSSTLSMASVVGAFLLGLGLGARVCGPVADSLARPILWYGACEIGIGLLALMIPWEIDLLWNLSVQFYSRLRELPVEYALVRCVMTIAVIGPPCVLMGATLPLLVRHLARLHGIGAAAGWLYGINTLGAAVGCYVMGFHLLPEMGLFWSNVAAALTNMAIGLTAVRMARKQAPIGDSEWRIQDSGFGIRGNELAADRQYPPGAVYLVSALTGCAALMLQTVWSRQLALVLGSSTYAFSAMLFVVLAGLGLGSLLYRSLVSNCNDGVSILLVLLSAVVLTTVAGMWAVPFAADCVGVSVQLRANYATNAVVCIGASALVELLPAIAMGSLFPCLIHVSRGMAPAAGTVVGRVYAWNTLGTLTGAIATTVWIVPTWGTHAAVLVALLMYIGTASTIVTCSATNAKVYAVLTLAAVAVGVYCTRKNDLLRANQGMFLYGYNNPEQPPPEVLYFKEGTASNVLVTKAGDVVSFRVNGKVDGNNRGDMSMQLGLAYLPRFLSPKAGHVLVIGFGTGTTSGASLLFPDTRVTCCEIEPAIVSAAPHFAEVNHSPQESSSFTIVHDDARAYVQGTDVTYDLILSEPSNPWIAGVANLFTSEFYRIANRKLAPNGIFAQWIQTYSFTPEDYAMIIRTMRSVFPYLRLIRISQGDTILLAANESLNRDSLVVQASQGLVDASPVIQEDLNRYFGTTDIASLLFTHLILDEVALDNFINIEGSGRYNLDCDLQLEFRAARHLYAGAEGNVGRRVLAVARRGWFVENYSRLGCNARHSPALHELATLFLNADLKDTAAVLVDIGLGSDPNAASLLADQLIIAGRLEPKLLDRLLASSDRAAIEANRVGLAYSKKERYADAVVVFDQLCQRYPNATNAWTNLAINSALSGNRQQAEFSHRRALELDPTSRFSREAFDSFTAGDVGKDAPGTMKHGLHAKKRTRP